MLPSETGVSILAPADVSPGHIIFAPLRMNRIAPLSTCKRGSINGSIMIRRNDNESCKYIIDCRCVNVCTNGCINGWTSGLLMDVLMGGLVDVYKHMCTNGWING